MDVEHNIAAMKYKSTIPYTNDTLAEYRRDTRYLEREVFRDDLFIAFGVVGNPKAQRAFDIAWDNSHDTGLYEVMMTFSELVDLIKD